MTIYLSLLYLKLRNFYAHQSSVLLFFARQHCDKQAPFLGAKPATTASFRRRPLEGDALPPAFCLPFSHCPEASLLRSRCHLTDFTVPGSGPPRSVLLLTGPQSFIHFSVSHHHQGLNSRSLCLSLKLELQITLHILRQDTGPLRYTRRTCCPHWKG